MQFIAPGYEGSTTARHTSAHNILACGVYEVIVHCKSLEEFPGCDLAPLS